MDSYYRNNIMHTYTFMTIWKESCYMERELLYGKRTVIWKENCYMERELLYGKTSLVDLNKSIWYK